MYENEVNRLVDQFDKMKNRKMELKSDSNILSCDCETLGRTTWYSLHELVIIIVFVCDGLMH